MGEVSFWFLCPVGVFLLIRAGAWRLERLHRTARANSLTQPLPHFQAPPLDVVAPNLRPRPAKYRHRRLGSFNRPAFTRMSWIGLVLMLTYVAIDVPVWALFMHTNIVSKGLQVRLWHAQVPTTAYTPSIVVRLTLQHRQLYIDGQPVTRENFENELRKKLIAYPPKCPIYFQGDRALEWHDAAEVIDLIRKLGGNVIL
jgi:biopolymer transport protein ExbD